MSNKKTITITIEYYKALKILKPRQIEVLEQVAKGRTNKEIGHKLSVSSHTVKTHRVAICKKLGLEGYRSLFHWCEEFI